MKPAKLALAALPLALLSTLALAQVRVSKEEAKKKAEDVPAMLTELEAAWKAERYGRCQAIVRDLTTAISARRTAAILAAFPPAPEGWTIVEDKRNDQQHNAMAAAFATGVGTVIQQRYRPVSGSGEINLTVTADSPMLAMFGTMLANPAMLGPDAEKIRYEGGIDGVLRKEGSDQALQLKIDETLVEARGRGQGADADAILGLVSQKAIDDISAAIRN